MKFGLRYHELLVPKWQGHYVDYNGLRQKLRGASCQNQSSSFLDVLHDVDRSVKGLESFASSIHDSILGREVDLRAVFGLPEDLDIVPSAGSVDGLELGLALAGYRALLEGYEELRRFHAVNHAALSRLFAKLSDLAEDDDGLEDCRSGWLLLHQKQDDFWQKNQQRACRHAELILQELSRPTRRETWSWCADKFMCSDVYPDTKPNGNRNGKGLYELVKADALDAVEEHFLPNQEKPLCSNRAGPTACDLFLQSLVLSATKTMNLCVEVMLRQEERLTVEQAFRAVQICGLGRQVLNGEHLSQAERCLCTVLDAMGSQALGMLQHRDYRGSLLLHYAARHGLESVCQFVASYLAKTGAETLAQAVLTKNDDMQTPLDCAALAGSMPVLALLLRTTVLPGEHSNKRLTEVKKTVGDVLVLAAGAGDMELAELLLEHGGDVEHRSSRGETALFCAARAGHVALTRLLVGKARQAGSDVDAAEPSRGWTSLTAACAHGHTAVAEVLLPAGAGTQCTDAQGWSALEHAIYRGHFAVSALLRAGSVREGSLGGGPATAIRTGINDSPRLICDVGEKVLIIHLGSTQGGHDQAFFRETADDQGEVPRTSRQGHEQSLLEIEISMSRSASHAQTVSYPLLDEQLHKPLIFKMAHDAPAQITVKVYRRQRRQSCCSSRMLVGSGTSVLDQGLLLGDKYESLIRERSVYMFDNALRPWAVVLLSFVVARPFRGLKKQRTVHQVRRPDGSFRLVGHRDVQVTRDMEPVVHHDFSLSETGTDVPVHSVTLEQYKYADQASDPQVTLTRRRAWSAGDDRSQAKAAELRAVDLHSNGFKPNGRGHVIKDSMTTLEELLIKIPVETGFNIELKYPRLHEATEAGAAPVALEINAFIDAALAKIVQYAGQRQIILSSFTPEVCILLSIKQQAYPVMFITNAGKLPNLDRELRTASLQAALRFARLWKLAGVVVACESFILCPRLVRLVKNMGLACASYGLANNDPLNAAVQVAAGIDFLIVDRVGLIAERVEKS